MGFFAGQHRLAGQFGGNGAGGHRVHADAEVGQGQRHGPRELVDTAFAHVVAGDVGDGQHRVDRTHVDDGAAPGALHGTGCGLAHQERALDVHLDHRIEILFGHVQKVGRLENACVVDQHIDAAKGLQHMVHQSVDIGFARDVAGHETGAVACTAQFGGHSRAALAVHIGQHHMGLFGRKAAGTGLTNAVGRPGDDDDAALQAKREGVGGGHGGDSLGSWDKCTAAMLPQGCFLGSSEVSLWQQGAP